MCGGDTDEGQWLEVRNSTARTHNTSNGFNTDISVNHGKQDIVNSLKNGKETFKLNIYNTHTFNTDSDLLNVRRKILHNMR